MDVISNNPLGYTQLNNSNIAAFHLAEVEPLGPLSFRPLQPFEAFEPNMAKIVGPMIIMFED